MLVCLELGAVASAQCAFSTGDSVHKSASVTSWEKVKSFLSNSFPEHLRFAPFIPFSRHTECKVQGRRLYEVFFVWVLFSESRIQQLQSTLLCIQKCTFVQDAWCLSEPSLPSPSLCNYSNRKHFFEIQNELFRVCGDVLRCLCGVMRFIDGILFYLHRQSESLTRIVLPVH